LTTPVVALALMITLAGMALILDRIWLETAQLELTMAAEATALAAARQLAADDRLAPNLAPTQRLDAARTAAEALAAGNLVAGQIPSFSVSGTDILFGNYTEVQQNGSIQFDTAVTDPLSVRITLHRSRARNNPVALFVGDLTGVPFGNVVRQADATVNNHIAGVRPVTGGFAPGLPLAIWKNDPSGNRNDTWDVQIEQRKGPDNYRYDATSRKPAPGGDGIPEIIVRSLARGGRPELCNLQVLDIGTGFDDAKLLRQFQSGWSDVDLQSFDGMLTVVGGTTLTSTAQLPDKEADALETLSGEPRICMIFTTAVPSGNQGYLQTTCVDFVAVRVMDVEDQTDGSCMIILQPTVMATRCAVITTVLGQPPANSPNKYVYNLQLTN
jgi:hypothetical protein